MSEEFIIEEQGKAGGVVDSLNDTYRNLAGRSLTTGFFHEAPNDTHNGVVEYVSMNETGRDIGEMFGQHIKDHGGTNITVLNDNQTHSGHIIFKDGDRHRVASYSTRKKGGNHMLVFHR